MVLARVYGTADPGTTDITDNKSNTYTRRDAAGLGGVATKASSRLPAKSCAGGAMVVATRIRASTIDVMEASALDGAGLA